MRIGEIKNIIGDVLNSNNQIIIESENFYSGQAYRVNNYHKIITALDILSKQKWNDLDYSQIENIKSKHTSNGPRILTVEEFNQLNAYINAINSRLPLYYLVLESLSEKQDEKTINIKLPHTITSLSALNEFNKRLESILKLFNVDGQFEVKGFDKGTDWYIIVGTGYLSYHFIIACLKITQEYFKTRTEFFNSQQARIAYEATLNSKESFTVKGFEEFKEKYLSLFIQEEVKKTIDELGRNGQTEAELQAQLVKATTKLVEELGEGTEFHLSLNPPSYISEKAGEFEIDYKRVKALNPQKEEVVKTLGSSNNKQGETQKEI